MSITHLVNSFAEKHTNNSFNKEKAYEQIREAFSQESYGKPQNELSLMNLLKKYFTKGKALLDINDIIPSKDVGWTPLITCAYYGYVEEVKFLLDNGADAKKIVAGSIPLHIATVTDKPILCLYLLKEGADINVQSTFGKTAMMYACEKGNVEIVDLFLEHDADIELKDKDNKNCMDYSIANNHYAIARKIEYTSMQKSIPINTGYVPPKRTKI